MKVKKINSILYFALFVMIACNTSKDDANKPTANQQNWKYQFDKKLPLLGHRNWILIVDKAFPEQNSAGMEYINTDEQLLPTLEYVLGEINKSSHVKPIIYQDKELSFITEAQSKGVTQFTEASKKLFANQPVQTMLHDSVFMKLDKESKLFKVLVIKTNETIPYSSVFLQLDCTYWNDEKEVMLRMNMKQK
jgi:D-ribose pyranose/furanose isomerase RbsD